MVSRIRRTVDIAMSNYEGIIGSCVFTSEGHVVYCTENMRLSESDLVSILDSWNGRNPSFLVKSIEFIPVMMESSGFVAINPAGAVSLIVGTGKGVWFVSCFAPMDQDKAGILKECIQAAKLLEASVSIFDT
ncbi:MAG: hypothetical protein EAX95_11555 [Candidatus Thorarchaeota archaeon]|nr:hypothetical protein [Candidatus Thorarchaeota archaeon]